MPKKALISTVLLFSLLAAVAIVNLTEANFYYKPPPTLPVIEIEIDGSINPSTDLVKRIDNTYVLTDDILQKYVFEVYCSNIVVDGQNYSLNGDQFGGSGICLTRVNNVTIKNIQLSSFTFAGICLDNSSNCTISEINATNIGSSAIYLVQSNENVIVNNRINSNCEGISLQLSNGNELFGNNITNYGFNQISSCSGIVLLNSQKNIISQNNVIGKHSPISVVTLSYPDNYTLSVPSSDNKLYLNNFVNNSNPVYFQDSPFANSWDDGEKGNYWSNYNGTDVNRDGIGDSPYLMNVNNTDNFPLMSPVGIMTTPNISPLISPSLSTTTSSIPIASPSPTVPELTPLAFLVLAVLVSVVVILKRRFKLQKLAVG